MKNPYKVLGLPLDATPSQIVRAQAQALRTRKYSMKEITEAQTILRKPSSRLAADFTFPVLDQGSLAPLSSRVKSKETDLSKINVNKYNSLK